MLKKYPTDFSNQVLHVLRAMSFTDGKHVKLVGSFSLRDQVYAGDIDSIERIPARSIRDIVVRFQNNVKQLIKMPFTYIGDIKCGSIHEWIVVPDSATIRNGKVVGYDPVSIMKRVDELYNTKIITDEQYGMAKRLVKKHVSVEDFIELQKELRFNIIRWDYKEIIIGHKFLQDGRRYTLEEAVQAPTITKMDIVSWIAGNHFMDFEMIYVFKIGNRIINKDLVAAAIVDTLDDSKINNVCFFNILYIYLKGSKLDIKESENDPENIVGYVKSYIRKVLEIQSSMVKTWKELT
jgi:hypothetical protein